MWKCKKCGSEDIIGTYKVSTTSFDWDGEPDEFDFKIEECDEVRCQDCNSKAYIIQDMANYIVEDTEDTK